MMTLPATIRLGSRVLVRCDECEGWHAYGDHGETLCWCGWPAWAHRVRHHLGRAA